MPTGACGINCDFCKLRLLGICSSCGSGKSQNAIKKLEAQRRIFSGSCAILECAVMNKIEYCMRDCNSFPCDNFRTGRYPFSDGFLDMQERRREQLPPARTPDGNPVKIDAESWKKLKNKDLTQLCNFTLTTPYLNKQNNIKGLLFHFLKEDILVDIENNCIKRIQDGSWKKTDDPILELVTLEYFNKVDTLYPLRKDLVSPRDLKEAHYFQGKHSLNLDPVLERYGNDKDGFIRTAKNLGGTEVEMANIAFILSPFPRIPLYFLFWEGNEEFGPELTVLFDRSIEIFLSASAIWCLVNRVCIELIRGPEKKL